ncbi:MAG: DedA family protein [Gammaproteobacteria bacterium]|nr:DedA family protein [Gammaproteobacteria bacterium]
MKLFSSLYERVMRWAAHRHAQWYLAGLSFAESSFFPVPPDVMLAPMALANTSKAWRFALITTFASVIGGAAGYLLGVFAFELIQPLLEKAGYMDKYQLAVSWFEQWGVWVVFVAGFSPIPYKLFTIAAGVVSMSFPPFMLASFVGRGARFFIVAGLMVWGGSRMESMLRQNVDRLGWAVVVVVGVVIVVMEFV